MLRPRDFAAFRPVGTRSIDQLTPGHAALRAIGLLTDFLALHAVPEPTRSAEAFLGLLEGEPHRRALLGVGAPPSPAERDAAVRFAVSLLLGPSRSPAAGG